MTSLPMPPTQKLREIHRRTGARTGGILAVLLLALAVTGSAPAAAAETHLFDATLSLTGDCSTSGVDPIPDPGCPGPPHPPTGFVEPSAVTTDQDGNLFVATFGHPNSGAGGGIDIFDPDGAFVYHLSAVGAMGVAIDSLGNLYVYQRATIEPDRTIRLARFMPSKYVPQNAEIEYANPPTTILAELEEGLFSNNGIAVNPANDHIFVVLGTRVNEYGSATEGNPLLDKTIGQGDLRSSKWLAIDGSTGLLYVSDANLAEQSSIKVFDTEAVGNPLLGVVTGAGVPAGSFKSNSALISPAVDEETGHLFVEDFNAAGGGKKYVYEFGEFASGTEGAYVGRIERSFSAVSSTGKIWIDNSESDNQGYLYAPSSPNHILAFERIPASEPPEIGQIEIENVTEADAEVSSTVNPRAVETTYEFTVTAVGEGEVPAVVGAGVLPASSEPLDVSAVARGLAAGTEYRVELSASNSAGSDDAETVFKTFAAQATSECPNDALRQGLSSQLPDCRAYELVTPPDTNGHEPGGITFGQRFTMPLSNDAGTDFAFLLNGGSLPGTEGTGAFNGDAYRAIRGPNGWQSIAAGPTGAESEAPIQGSMSPDHGYSFWVSGEGGTAEVGGKPTTYLRYPSGESRLIGRGSLDTDPRAAGRLITDEGQHVIFETGAASSKAFDPPVQLEPDAPPSGTVALYDRTADETTHVVSLLPGNVTPSAGENAFFRGASRDGNAIAFGLGKQEATSSIYLRVNNASTIVAAPANARFAGLSDDGGTMFYEAAGDIFSLSVPTSELTQLTTSGDASLANVSADGASAYFISPTVLTGAEASPAGAVAQAGQNNLYYWKDGVVSFVATLTERDAKGESNAFAAGGFQNGAGLWANAMFVPPQPAVAQPAIVSTRASDDGRVLLFESRAPLTGQATEGLPQIYRYDNNAASLSCLSCPPTKLPSSAGSRLQMLEINSYNKLYYSAVGNLRADGQRAFFESAEALVPEDSNGVMDVYQWEAEGVGSCTVSEGCVSLISSGRSSRDSYLYGASESGDNVFFLTADQLTSTDTSGTPSVYDARVNGGFASAASTPCAGEGCRSALTPAPGLGSPASPAGPSGNVARERSCPKGKRKVRKKGRVSCATRHGKQRHGAKRRNDR